MLVSSSATLLTPQVVQSKVLYMETGAPCYMRLTDYRDMELPSIKVFVTLTSRGNSTTRLPTIRIGWWRDWSTKSLNLITSIVMGLVVSLQTSFYTHFRSPCLV